jgi:hypothetical protein
VEFLLLSIVTIAAVNELNLKKNVKNKQTKKQQKNPNILT